MRHEDIWRAIDTLAAERGLTASGLARRAGQIVSREHLLEALWDDIDFVDDNTLTVNVTRVRKKLEELGLGQPIETIRGQGYRLNMTWGESA